jgi:DNA replication protein DnaD
MDVDEKSNKLFEETLKQLNVWTNDINSTLAIERDIRAARFGLALKQINQLLSKDSTECKGAIRPLSRSDLLKKRESLLEKLDYKILVEYDKYNQIVSCPPSYMPF